MSIAAPVIPDPDFVAILRTYNDVTERLKRSHETLLAEVQSLGDELREKNKQLERRERLAALGEMAAGVAHEIRNPLGGIGLYASLLERDLADRPAQQEIARRISAGVQNLESIVRDILAFAGGAEPRFESTCLGAIVDAVVSQAAARIESGGIQLTVDGDLREERAHCDAGQIERALANLLFNAIDAAGEGGQVWIRQERGRRERAGAGRVAIVVEDNGPGVPAEIAGRIFNPFFTTKHLGTGLGLAIVHRIAEAHGGHVGVELRPGGGARFVLELPAAKGLSRDGVPRVLRNRAAPRETISTGT